MKEELFNKYIDGELHDNELKDFEVRLKNDMQFKSEFENYKTWHKFMKTGLKRQELKSQLEAIHSEMNSPSENISASLSKIKKIRTFGSIAAAAAVAAIVTLTVINFFGFPLFDNEDQYLELVNKVDDTQETLEKIVAENHKEAPQRFTGSCFAISSNGYLITNYHVIRGVDSIRILNKQDSLVSFRSRIVYRDVSRDLAVLKIDDKNFKSFGKLPFGIIEDEQDLGTYVFTLGYSKKDIVFGEGSISSHSGFKGDTMAYQVSIPVNPGNSGGPVFDQKANLIGIISGKNVQQEGAGFAIKAEHITEIIENLKELNPDDPPKINSRSNISYKKRPEQVKKIKDFVFKVQVYKS
jgi:serine protease Do